jgi:SAM-dependent methyltransferase
MTTLSFGVPPYPKIDQGVVHRYRDNYGLGDDIGENEVRRHWEVESALTQRLLKSTKSDRWAVFQQCYTELYSALPWLNKSEDEVDVNNLRPWLKLVPQGSSVFEVGSGKAELLKYLAANGHKCVATEITSERGERHAEGHDDLTWHVTDGINLTSFEAPSSYDVVISTQVVEHLHPDDMLDHLRNVREILRPGGSYIFDTPHVGAGPSDVSKVYGFDRPVCMHLKEYDFVGLGELLAEAGFETPKAVLFRERPFTTGPYAGRAFFKYCCAWDRLTRSINLSPSRERQFRGLLKILFVPTRIWLVAQR